MNGLLPFCRLGGNIRLTGDISGFEILQESDFDWSDWTRLSANWDQCLGWAAVGVQFQIKKNNL